MSNLFLADGSGDASADKISTAQAGNSLSSTSKFKLLLINWQNVKALNAVKRFTVSYVVIRPRSRERKNNTLIGLIEGNICVYL
jgi:hypothetical protein